MTHQSIMIGCLRLTDVSVIWRAVNPCLTSHKILGEVSCMEYTGQGNDFELIPTVKMETRHHVEGSFGNEFLSIYNHCGVMASWSRKTSKKSIFCVFLKTTPYGKIFKILFRKDSSRHRSTCCVQISWNLANGNRYKVMRYLPDKKFAWLSISRYCKDRAQNLAGQSQRMYSEYSRFRPNRFTLGWVIPERVNTVKTSRKMFPIFGWSLASSQIITNLLPNRFYTSDEDVRKRIVAR